MLVLVFLSLIGAIAAAPQYIMPFSSYPQYSSQMTPFITAQTMNMLPYTTAGMLPYDTRFMYPTLDMARSMSNMPKPVEDTPEVKQAKMEFNEKYQKALMGMHETTVVRAKRDLTSMMPMTYNYNYMTPTHMKYNMMAYNSHVSPYMSSMYSSPYMMHHY